MKKNKEASEYIDVKDLANDIRNTKKWKNSNNGKDISYINLYSCNSASTLFGVPPAQQLANELGKPVMGYTGEYGFTPIFPFASFVNNPNGNSKKQLFFPETKK